MNFKSLYRKVSDVLCVVMRSWPPHHGCQADNTKKQTPSDSQAVDAGDKLLLTDSSVIPQPTEAVVVASTPERIIQLTYKINYLLDVSKHQPIEGLDEVRGLLLRYHNAFLNFGVRSLENMVAPVDAIEGSSFKEFSEGLLKIDKMVGTLYSNYVRGPKFHDGSPFVAG